MFERKIAALKQLQEDLPEIVGEETVNLVIENFRQESYFGGKWRKLDARTLKRKDPRQGKLIRTTRLFNSISILKRTKNTVDVGIKASSGNPGPQVYGPVHNRGLRIRGGKMPRRQFLGKHPKQAAILEGIINEEILNALKQ